MGRLSVVWLAVGSVRLGADLASRGTEVVGDGGECLPSGPVDDPRSSSS